MVRKYHVCGSLQYLFKIFTVSPFDPFLIGHPPGPLLLEDTYDPVDISLGRQTCFGQRNRRSDLQYFGAEA